MRLVLAARSTASLETVAEECRAKGAQALVVPTDVSVDEQVVALRDAAVERYGRIDVWVGAASVFSYGAFEDTPAEVFRHQIEANLMGQVSSARAVLPVFRSQGSGVLVFVASIYSRVTSPYASGYVTSKFGLLGFAESLGQELKGSGISVCSVLPATIDTPIYQHAANFTGQRIHPIPPIVGPDRVARAIVRVSSSPRRSVVVGRTQASLIALHELLPAVYHRTVRPAMHLVAMRKGEVEPNPGNVFEPGTATNAVTGGWRWPAAVRLAPFAVLAAVAGAALRRRR
ncbi:SDR family NAD(P)-dependent oxidoreductase [Naasia aerilata]|uniref:Short-chain dehydrogenase n=1 Tax=Naasia aerilata TaxID=1162966 RepID=A0ABN6XP48_9MICO|nr:SDR family NAD(P)-dependent oxidoreductase [Naasia aerilata]BDZ46774.1 short-chain dehydrogenase [Naasia aerilata]